jgi:periplasmic divalent cation tolerance protein
MQHIVVFVTVSDNDEAERIARVLLDLHLCACVNIVDGLNSIYHWKGKIEHSPEKLLIIKTTITKYDQLEFIVKKEHSYTVPEIIALPIIAGSRDYLNWIDKETI